MSADIFYRQLIMLQKIPRYPRKTSARELVNFLSKEGVKVSIRTVQRDLRKLSKSFPDLRGDGEKDIQGWSWLRDTKINDIPNINEPMAFTFHLTEKFLGQLIPPSALGLIQPYFDHADEILKKSPGYAKWGNHVRVLSRTQPLIPATITGNVVEVVYEALFKQKQFRGRYKRKAGDEVEYVLHPLGLVFRESIIYLVATIWDYEDPLHFALHRFVKCEPLDEKAVSPDDFDLDEYIASGTFEYADIEGKKIKLVALFSDGTADHLTETPLNEDQIITQKRDGRTQVKATVMDSRQLRWWLLGFGHYVEVMRPKKLREEFVEISEYLIRIYNQSAIKSQCKSK